jgi:hypothetical protein
MRINVAVPEAHVTKPVLDAALESVTRLNEAMISKGDVPDFEHGLRVGVKWKPEPPGQEHFDHAGKVIARKWGDCDDLAPWHAASLRTSGKDPEARAVARRSGPHRWHAVVQRSDGSIDDPSKAAGMGSHVGIIGGVLPLMPQMFNGGGVVGSTVGAYIVKPAIAMRPVYGGFQARADLPWNWREHLYDKETPSDYAMTALHTAPVAASALTGAIDGIVELGHAAGFADEHDMHRLSAIADLCAGCSVQDVADRYGKRTAQHAVNVVGSFWSSLKKIANPIAKLARGAVKFIPGVGPVVDTGLNVAESALKKAQQAKAALSPGAPGGPGSGRGFTCTYF